MIKAIFFLVILMSVLSCGTAFNPYVIGGFDGTPDSAIDQAYQPHRCNLGEKADISMPLCPAHNVVQVTLHDYDACNPTNPFRTFDDQLFTCEEPGDFYFICALPYHCDYEGEKFPLRIGHYEPGKAVPITPSPSPVSAPSSSPVSASSPSPVSAPSSSPFSAPSPSPLSGSPQAAYPPKFRFFFN